MIQKTKFMADSPKSVTASIGSELYKTTLKTDKHTFVGDEPQDLGGQDLGPEPTDFLLASLASCTAITLRMYVNRKGWNVEEINVQVSINQDVIDGKSKTTFIRTVEAKGDLDEEQRSRLVAIANACPVHKILNNPIEVQTSLV
jgi:putative redox protein